MALPTQMKVGVNLFLSSPKSVTGAFIYIEEILPALFRAGRGRTYYLLGHLDTIKYFKNKYQNFSNVKYHVFDIRRDIFVNPIRALRKLSAKIRNDYATRETIFTKEVNLFLKKENIGLYFSPSQTIFPTGLVGVKNVTTILDLQFEYFPENFPASYLEKRRRDAMYAVEHSDCLIAISNYTKKTLVEKYDGKPEKIQTVLWAAHEAKAELVKIDAPQDFVLYPAALWPHKNHHVLIKALGILKDRLPTLHVIFTGLIKGQDLKRNLDSLIEKEEVKNRVSFLGFLSDGKLRSLYNETRGLVFPSSFEGFGIPLVEAMQFGVPIIAADNTSITEVVGNVGILVKTGDAEALAGAIEKVLTDKRLRDELIEKGRERAKIFSWEKAAEETLAVFNSI